MSDEPDPEIDDLFRPLARNYTEEALRRLDAALTRTNGNRQHALVILGMDKDGPRSIETVKHMINHTPWLKAKWSKALPKPPSVADPVDLDRPPSVIGPSQEAVAAAIAKQDAVMKQDITALFKPKEADLIRAIQSQYTGHLQQTLDLSYGGAVHSTAKMLVLQQELQQRLEEIDAEPERFVLTAYTREGMPYTVKDAHAYRMEVVDRLVKIGDLIRKNNVSINEATKTRLLADKLRREAAQSDKGPKTVAGWETPTEKKKA